MLLSVLFMKKVMEEHESLLQAEERTLARDSSIPTLSFAA